MRGQAQRAKTHPRHKTSNKQTKRKIIRSKKNNYKQNIRGSQFSRAYRVRSSHHCWLWRTTVAAFKVAGNFYRARKRSESPVIAAREIKPKDTWLEGEWRLPISKQESHPSFNRSIWKLECADGSAVGQTYWEPLAYAREISLLYGA